MFKFNNKDTHVYIVNFKHISRFSIASFVDFEQVNFSWDITSSNTIDNNLIRANPTKRSNTQTIRQQIADEFFECV